MRCYCGVDIKDIEERINLFDIANQTNRRIFTSHCSKCGDFNAQLEYFDTKKQIECFDKPKRKNLGEWLKRYQTEPYLILVQKTYKQGNKSNMNWFYQKNGKVYDFNNTFIRVMSNTIPIEQQSSINCSILVTAEYEMQG